MAGYEVATLGLLAQYLPMAKTTLSGTPGPSVSIPSPLSTILSTRTGREAVSCVGAVEVVQLSSGAL